MAILGARITAPAAGGDDVGLERVCDVREEGRGTGPGTLGRPKDGIVVLSDCPAGQSFNSSAFSIAASRAKASPIHSPNVQPCGAFRDRS